MRSKDPDMVSGVGGQKGGPIVEPDSNRTEVGEITAAEIDGLLREYAGEVVCRFASGICGYYVRFAEEKEGLEVVYSGPSGPENRPARVSDDNLERLVEESDCINFVGTEDSPYIKPEIRFG